MRPVWSTNQFVPKRGCSHAYKMLWEDDFCSCQGCGTCWIMTEKGWKVVPESWTDGKTLDEPDPYKRARGRIRVR